MGRWSYALSALLIILSSQSSETFVPAWRWRRANIKGSIGRTYTDSLSREEYDADAPYRYEGTLSSQNSTSGSMYDYSTPSLAQNDAFGRTIDQGNRDAPGDKIYEMYAEAWKTAGGELSAGAPMNDESHDLKESHNTIAGGMNAQDAQQGRGSGYSYTYDPVKNIAADAHSSSTTSETYNGAAWAGSTNGGITGTPQDSTGASTQPQDVYRMPENDWNNAGGKVSTENDQKDAVARTWPESPSEVPGNVLRKSVSARDIGTGDTGRAYTAGGWLGGVQSQNDAGDRMNTDIDLHSLRSEFYAARKSSTDSSTGSDHSSYNGYGMAGVDRLSSSPQNPTQSGDQLNTPSWSQHAVAANTGIPKENSDPGVGDKMRAETYHGSGADPLSFEPQSVTEAPSTSGNTMYNTQSFSQPVGAGSGEIHDVTSQSVADDGVQRDVQPTVGGGMDGVDPLSAAPQSIGGAPLHSGVPMYNNPAGDQNARAGNTGSLQDNAARGTEFRDPPNDHQGYEKPEDTKSFSVGYSSTLFNPGSTQYQYDGGSGTYDPPARTRRREREAPEFPRSGRGPQPHADERLKEPKEPPRSTVPRGVAAGSQETVSKEATPPVRITKRVPAYVKGAKVGDSGVAAHVEPNVRAQRNEGDRKEAAHHGETDGMRKVAASQNASTGNAPTESQRFPGVRAMEDDGIGRMPSWVRNGGANDGGDVAGGDSTSSKTERTQDTSPPVNGERTAAKQYSGGGDMQNMPQWARETLRGQNSVQGGEGAMREIGDGKYTKPAWAQSPGAENLGDGSPEDEQHSSTPGTQSPDSGSNYGELSAAPQVNSGRADMQNMPQWARETLRGKSTSQDGEGAMREIGGGGYTKPAWAQGPGAGIVEDGSGEGEQSSSSVGTQSPDAGSSYGEVSAAPQDSTGGADMQNIPQWAKEGIRGKSTGQNGEGGMAGVGGGGYTKPAWAQSPVATNVSNKKPDRTAEGTPTKNVPTQPRGTGSKTKVEEGAPNRPAWAKKPSAGSSSYSGGKPNMPAWAQKSISEYSPTHRSSGGGYEMPDWARSGGGVAVDLGHAEDVGKQDAPEWLTDVGGSGGSDNALGDSTQGMSAQSRDSGGGEGSGVESVSSTPWNSAKGDKSSMPSWARKEENGNVEDSQQNIGTQYRGEDTQNMPGWVKSSGGGDSSSTQSSPSPRGEKKVEASPNPINVNLGGDSMQNVPAWVRKTDDPKSDDESKPSWVRSPVIDSQSGTDSSGGYGRLQNVTQTQKNDVNQKKKSKVHLMPAWFSKVQNRDEEEDEVTAALEYFTKKMANNEDFKKMTLQERIAAAAAAVVEEKERKEALSKPPTKTSEQKETKSVTKALNKISETLHSFGGKEKKPTPTPKEPDHEEQKVPEKTESKGVNFVMLEGVSEAAEGKREVPREPKQEKDISIVKAKKVKAAVRGTVKDKKLVQSKEPEPMRKLAKIIAEKDSKRARKTSEPSMSKVEPTKPEKQKNRSTEQSIASTKAVEKRKSSEKKDMKNQDKTAPAARVLDDDEVQKASAKPPSDLPKKKKKEVAIGPSSQEARELATLMKSISAVLGVSNERTTKPVKAIINGEDLDVDMVKKQITSLNGKEKEKRKKSPASAQIDGRANEIDCTRFAEGWASLKYELPFDCELLDATLSQTKDPISSSASNGTDVGGHLGWRFSRGWTSFFSH